ncbi:MAG: ExbD/TolR family protein [Pseudobdellovibrionaceae bacterium]
MPRRRNHLQPPPKGFILNLTSMCDVFTILLVFLLQTYASSSILVPPAEGVKLPSSSSEASPVKAINLVVSKEAIIIDGETVAKVQERNIASEAIDRDDPSFIKPLFVELEKRAKAAEAEKQSYGQILVQADQELPYETLRKVMYTASMAGFPQLKMATIVGE